MYSHALHIAKISNVSCVLIHYTMLKCLISHVFSCINQCWNIWCFMYSHALRNAELSNISYILMFYAMLKYLIYHVLRYAEISVVSCITQCWNVGFLIFHVVLKSFVYLACIMFCRNIRFLSITLFLNICFHL